MSGELIGAIIGGGFGLMGLAGSVVGIYVKLSNDIAVLKQRMNQEEIHTDHFNERHQEHDKRINDTVLSIERQLSEIKILIEQKIK